MDGAYMIKANVHSDVLVHLITENNYKKIAEVGIYTSSTTKKILKTTYSIIDEYWAIDRWLAWSAVRKKKQDEWDSFYFYACRLMRYYPKLHVVRLDSIEASKLFPKFYFDLVYIDADHLYEPYTNDIKSYLPLVRKGGTIGGHDYDNNKRIVTEGKQAVDDFFGIGQVQSITPEGDKIPMWWKKIE